jgi:hypothetical protein
LYRFDYNETKILRCYIERPLLSKADVQDLALGFSFTNDRFTPYSVEKLRITTTGKSNGISRSPGARITDQLCRSELRQAGFSCDFCHPLVHTVRNAAQIANKISVNFKTEFFNRIRPRAAVRP